MYVHDSEFQDWYNDLSKGDINEMISFKRDRKQGWWDYFLECYEEHLQEDAEYSDYQDEMAWLGRNYWKI